MNFQGVFIFCALITSVLWRELVADDGPKCGIKKVLRDVTFQAGMNAGKFVPVLQETKTIEDCVNYCCLDPKYDLVYKINDYCFCVVCKTIWACRSRPVPRPPRGFRSTAITLMRASPSTDMIRGRVTIFRPVTLAPTRRKTKPPPTRRPTRKKLSATKATRKPVTLRPTTEITRATAKVTTRVVTYGPPVVLSATGYGNEAIALQCPGEIRVLRVIAFNTEGDKSTIASFQKVCRGSMVTKSNQRVCYVSLSRVFGVTYPDDTETIISYECRPGPMI